MRLAYSSRLRDLRGCCQTLSPGEEERWEFAFHLTSRHAPSQPVRIMKYCILSQLYPNHSLPLHMGLDAVLGLK